MKKQQATEIIEILPKGRTIFRYFKNRYALELLGYFVGEGKTVGEVKKSAFGRLLQKPTLKELVSRLGRGRLTRADLQAQWPAQFEAYLLTLGLWGERGLPWFYQTSRAGTNLVLQLNFSAKHDRPYQKHIQPGEEDPFQYWGHPINRDGRHTLAWARIDLDFDSGEALIEEIQTDWIRLATRRRISVEAIEQDDEELQRVVQRSLERNGIGTGPRELERYITDVLAPHMGIWDEAVLFAAIWFLREEIGIRRIFYHTFDSGNWLKRIGSFRQPPRSLYTTLPRRFCFRECDETPKLLHQPRSRRVRARQKHDPLRFFLLEI